MSGPLVDPTSEVWSHSRSAGTERVILLALAHHADPDGYCWPGLERIASMANVGARATQAALAKLVESGELAVLRGRGRGHASLYRVVLGQPEGAGWEGAPFGVGVQPAEGRRVAVSYQLRCAVFERDGHACRCCGAGKPLRADHVIPVAQGGETTFENLQTLCAPCNSAKSTRDKCPCEGRGWEGTQP